MTEWDKEGKKQSTRAGCDGGHRRWWRW